MSNKLYQLSDVDIAFPNPENALTSPDGLLAIGGDLTLPRLSLAYKNGIFPWFSDNEPIMWWSPSARGIVELEEFHISKSLRKHLKKHPVTVTINTAFEEVIEACREQRIDSEGTWITDDMQSAYISAHHAGFAHSLEVWSDNELAGGLYGIMQNGVFCGESMFHNKTNCSKLAMWALVNWLKRHNAHFIDCQLENPYLMSLGAKIITRNQFLSKLKIAENFTVQPTMWEPQKLERIYD
jgi:leucyl/phenylalanyl-tRNA--protein transferase